MFGRSRKTIQTVTASLVIGITVATVYTYSADKQRMYYYQIHAIDSLLMSVIRRTLDAEIAHDLALEFSSMLPKVQ